MANITQLKHLEHIEDEMLSGYMQTKWDGAPSVVCGKHPITGRFFVGTKSVFNKEPKLCHFDDDVDVYYSGDLATKLKTALQYFKPLGITGVIQGDLLFTEKDKKTVTVNNENLITFTPNTITYGVPVNSDMGKKISTAKIGVVFHTHYNGDDLSSMTASAGAPTSEFSKTTDCVVIENDTPMADVAVPTNTLQLFERNTNTIESMCKKSGKFLDTLVDNMGTSGDKKFHIASYLKQFFNNEIKEGRSISDSQKAIKSIGEFYRTKMNKEVEKMKRVQKQAERRKQMYDGMAYLEDNITEFDAMFTLYRKMQENKEIVIKALDNLETFRTFVQTDKGYKVTGPEGYVLHHDGDMIKLVNRIEFSYNNFTLAKQWR